MPNSGRLMAARELCHSSSGGFGGPRAGRIVARVTAPVARSDYRARENRYMMLDAYSYCPGGTGKKIKHCECRDIAGELEKIIKAIEGDQRVAALDRINRTLATKAHRPCLLTLKIVTLLGMKDMQGLEDTVTTFVKVAPNNPLAHTFAAMLESRKCRSREAVDEIQTALSLLTDTMPGELYDAFGEVAQVLADDGEYLAARHTSSCGPSLAAMKRTPCGP